MTYDTGYAGPYKSNVLGKKTKILQNYEKFLSIKYQIEWIKGIQKQVDFANNPQVLSDFTLQLKIKRRFTNC
jgi:hypothetical protein